MVFTYSYGYFVVGLGYGSGSVYVVDCNGSLGS